MSIRFSNTTPWQLSPTGVASGIFFVELMDSGSFTYNDNNSVAEATYLVDWNYVAAFMSDLRGYYQLKADGTINRSTGNSTLPDIHPKWSPGRYATTAPSTGLYCIDAKVEGNGVFYAGGPGTAITQDPKAGSSIRFNAARVRATYQALPFDILPDSAVTSELSRYCERNYTFNYQYATYFGKMKFVTTAQEPAVPPGQIVGILEKTITWHKVPSNPTNPYNVPTYSTVKTLLGKTNSLTFDGDPAGSVLFMGIDPKRSVPDLVSGQVYWDIVYKFAVKNSGAALGGDGTDAVAGWNYILNGYPGGPSQPFWDLITADGTTTGGRIYSNGDLNTLFVIPGS